MKSTEEIQGWFHSGDCAAYDILLSTIPENGIFVECGAWMGRSSSYLCDHARSDIKIYIVDSWQGSVSEQSGPHSIALTQDVYQIFLDNMGDRKFSSIRKLSEEASKDFEDESCDVVFIDMEHTYDSVTRDIELWYPKVKYGGYISGHDYTIYWPDVKRAVQNKFDITKIKTMGDCWIVKKENI